MRLVVLLVVFGWMPRADAEPGWGDLRKCVKKVPQTIGLIAGREKDGTTDVGMPLYGLGGRGPAPEERCLATTAATLALPSLPAEVERVGFAYTITDPPASTTPPTIERPGCC